MKRTSYSVYTFLNSDGDVLYVGCARDLRQRTQSHRQTKRWWPQVADIQFEEVLGRREARVRERELIAELEPKHNKPRGQTASVGPQEPVCERCGDPYTEWRANPSRSALQACSPCTRTSKPTAEDMYPLDEWADDLAHRRRTQQDIGDDWGITRQAVSLHVNKYRPDWSRRRQEIDAAVKVAEAAERARDCDVCGTTFVPQTKSVRCSSHCADIGSKLRRHTDVESWSRHQVAMARWNIENLSDERHEYEIEYWQKILDGRTDEIDRHGRWLVEGSAAWDAAVEVVGNGWPLADELHPAIREQVETYLSERSVAA